MKTEDPPSDLVWANNVELLTQPEECLPVIGSCQVSSILSTLEPEEHPQNIDLIVVPSNDYKIPIDSSVNFQSSYVILKEHGVNKKEKSKQLLLDPLMNREHTFEDMLYFVCNLCPFLCTKDTKITEHLENAHKNKTVRKLAQLKCPACSNIFYHKLPLRSHLIHDHGVSNSDLTVILQAVVYYSTKNNAKIKELHKNKNNSFKLTPKNEMNSNKLEKVENISEDDHVDDDECDYDPEDRNCAKQAIQERKADQKSVSLPQVDIAHNNTEKIFNSLMKATDSVTKYMDSKKMHRCELPLCKVRLQDINKLNYHVSCHTPNGFQCAECKENFTFWKPLSGHLWRSHKIDMELYSCDKCDYKTFSLAKLNNIHKLIHSEVKSFKCDNCEKAFKNIKQLRNHKITHKEKTERLLHICEVCCKYFTHKKQLKVHLDVVHRKIKPYLCSYCGYKGPSRSSLKMHMRQHTGEKPFICDFCNYATSDHNSLRRHKLRHTGQKPYKCAYCSYACIQSSTYKVHLKTKHPGMEKDLMFTCHECQYRSVNKDNFSMHMATVHKQQPQFSVA